MTPSNNPQHGIRQAALAFVILAIAILLLFRTGFKPGRVLFSNDAPLGVIQSHAFDESLGWAFWQDLNWLGGEQPSLSPNITAALFQGALAMTRHAGPVLFANWYAPAALLLLGLAAWLFFRQLRFSPAVCLLGGLAAALNGDLFSYACWGLPSVTLTAAAAFAAMAVLQSGFVGRPWVKTILAGVIVGLGVMEAYDVGALFSLLVAAFVLCSHLVQGGALSPQGKLGRGFLVIILMAAVAAVMAAHALQGLVNTQVKGVAILQSTPENKQERWDWATQWSLPKVEMLRVLVPGLFGYRMDSPGGGDYWGAVGQQAGWEQHHQGLARHSGYGPYVGLLLVLAALWAGMQSLRPKGGPFDETERRLVWFWLAVGAVSLLLSLGRHGLLYQFLFPLPFFKSIRNPVKFLHLFSVATVILAAYGLQGIWRRHVDGTKESSASFYESFRRGWAGAAAFDRHCMTALIAAVPGGLFLWLLYSSSFKTLQRHLAEQLGFEPLHAQTIAQFSVNEVGLAVLFLVLSVLALLAIMTGWFAGRRAKWAGLVMGIVLAADLVRANAPYVVYYNYPHKYASNPVLDFLRQKPHEQRVVGIPMPLEQHLVQLRAEHLQRDRSAEWLNKLGEQFSALHNVYRIEWAQHHFHYYRIQSLDLVQESRAAADNLRYRETLRTSLARLWELTGTRWMLGVSGNFIGDLNQLLDPDRRRFRVQMAFDLEPKPDRPHPGRVGLEDVTAVPRTNGLCGLIEFTGALPRAKLYTRWEAGMADEPTLRRLADPQFDPWQSVLLAEPIGAPPPAFGATNAPAGSVLFESYDPKRIVLQARAAAPSILILNDKHHPEWKVLVDGKPAALLRANYLMRGVQLPAGEHRVEFRFDPATPSLYVSFTGLALGLAAVLYLLVTRRKAA
jgi:hypothetical protein